MSTRLPLKKSVDKPLGKYVDEIIGVDAETTDAERAERRKQKVGPSIASLCARVQGCTPARIETLAKTLSALPRTSEYIPALTLVGNLKRRAETLVGGDEVPPVSNWVHKDLLPELVMSCQFLQCNIHELTATAWWLAEQEHPEVFAEGCDDLGEHVAMIEKLREKRARLIYEAANTVVLEDLELHFYTGHAKVWYAGTNQQVPASAPGDPQGIEALVAWKKANLKPE